MGLRQAAGEGTVSVAGSAARASERGDAPGGTDVVGERYRTQGEQDAPGLVSGAAGGISKLQKAAQNAGFFKRLIVTYNLLK